VTGSTGRTLTSMTEMLAAWLPGQRWFPGRGTALSDLTVLSDVALAEGEPGLRHLVVEAALPHGRARFQVLVGSRADLPRRLSEAVIGEVDGTTYFDALHDTELPTVLIGGIAAERKAGQISFVREPAAQLRSWPDCRRLTAEQSNTSLVFGEQVILKVLRRLFPGQNPDLEVADALARLGSARVAVPFGWIETEIDGEPFLLAVLSEYLANASDGWAMAGAAVRGLLGVGPSTASPSTAGTATASTTAASTGKADKDTPFAAQARALGEATAELHADLARAFGTRQMSKQELSGLADDLDAKLADAVRVVPELRKHAERIGAAFDAIRSLEDPVTVQRIHGDYHLGQVMYARHGWVALDFEGEPGVPLATRRAMAPPMRDVAGMLRSFDYAARHQLIGRPDAPRKAAAASDWAETVQAEFRAGYASATDATASDAAAATPASAHGHDVQDRLLRALTLEKAVYEVVYEHRHRPSWVSIPLDFLASA
jgi:maltokinase